MNDRRGVSSVLGVVLILGITITVVTVILASSAIVLADAQTEARISQMENSMAQMSSKASLVALGESGSHHFDLGSIDNADVETRPDSGHITITLNESDGNLTTLYEAPLGAIVYTNDGIEIAYQAGGVWKKQNGGSTMISPPEFYYRGATLTLPIIHVDGDFRGSGAIQGRITQVDDELAIYPDEVHRNPMANESLIIEVESDYYRGWENFFRDRTEGDITVDEDNTTVSVELTAEGTLGAYELSEAILISGIDSDPPLDEFSLTLEGDEDFNGVFWSLYHDGDQEFEIFYDHRDGQHDLRIYFREGDTEEMWYKEDIEIEDAGDVEKIHFDFISESMNLTLDTGNGGPNQMQSNPGNLEESVVIDDTVYDDANENASMYTVMQHYFGIMDGPILLESSEHNTNQVSHDASSGRIQYDPAGGVIQYLHITSRAIQIDAT